MDRMPVNNQVDLAFGLFAEPVDKVDEHFDRKGPFEDTEAKMTLIRHSGNHGAVEALARTGNDRRLTPQAVASSDGVVRTEPHLIRPVDDGFLLLSSLGD